MPNGDVYAIASALSWSISVVLMRVSGFQIPPLPLTFFKNCVAIVCFAAVLLVQGESWVREIPEGAYLRLAVSAVLGELASLVMVLWALLQYPKALRQNLFLGFCRRESWRAMIPMAIMGPFIATLFWVAGFKYLAAGRAAIFNPLSTVFIILLAYFFLKERFTVRKAIGTILAVAGALLVALS